MFLPVLHLFFLPPLPLWFLPLFYFLLSHFFFFPLFCGRRCWLNCEVSETRLSFSATNVQETSGKSRRIWTLFCLFCQAAAALKPLPFFARSSGKVAATSAKKERAIKPYKQLLYLAELLNKSS